MNTIQLLRRAMERERDSLRERYQTAMRSDKFDLAIDLRGKLAAIIEELEEL